MKQVKTDGIILHRVNYQDYDRILTVLSPDSGKINLIAKGVRRPTSKLAGSLELFATTHLNYILGRGEINTLISARLIKYYPNITLDLDRTEWCFSVLKLINHSTEQSAGEDIYWLLESTLEALNDRSLKLELIKLWFSLHFLDVMGHRPNLSLEPAKDQVPSQQKFRFNLEKMAFAQDDNGSFVPNHIKLLRLIEGHRVDKLAKIDGVEQWLSDLNNLMKLLMVSNGYKMA
jgi:DNA repair protein RecO